MAGTDSTCPPLWLAQGASGIWIDPQGALHQYLDTLTPTLLFLPL